MDFFHWYHHLFLWAPPLVHRGPLGAKALWWSVQEGEKPIALPLLLCCVCCTYVCAICNAYTREFYKYFDETAYLILLAAFSLPKTHLRTVCPSSHPCSPCLAPSPRQNEFSPRRCPAPRANSESVPPVMQTSSTNISPSWSSSWDLSYIFFEWNICSPFAKVFMVTHEPPSWKVEKWYWLSGNWGTGALLLAGSQAVLLICVRPWPWLCCLICPVVSWTHPCCSISSWLCYKCCLCPRKATGRDHRYNVPAGSSAEMWGQNASLTYSDLYCFF